MLAPVVAATPQEVLVIPVAHENLAWIFMGSFKTKKQQCHPPLLFLVLVNYCRDVLIFNPFLLLVCLLSWLKKWVYS